MKSYVDDIVAENRRLKDENARLHIAFTEQREALKRNREQLSAATRMETDLTIEVERLINTALDNMRTECMTNLNEAETNLANLREKVELAIHALMPIVPLSGSWNSGYSVPDHIDPKLVAMIEEWANAAYAVAELHAELTGIVA